MEYAKFAIGMMLFGVVGAVLLKLGVFRDLKAFLRERFKFVIAFYSILALLVVGAAYLIAR